jgi:hypothetical protein
MNLVVSISGDKATGVEELITTISCEGKIGDILPPSAASFGTGTIFSLTS